MTVNTAPERAKLLIGRMIEALRDRYEIIYDANCSSEFPWARYYFLVSILILFIAMEEVAPTVRLHQPEVLFSASMWSAEEAAKIRGIAQRERPGIGTHAIPQGLQVERGPDAIVEYLVEVVPGLLDSLDTR